MLISVCRKRMEEQLNDAKAKIKSEVGENSNNNYIWFIFISALFFINF